MDDIIQAYQLPDKMYFKIGEVSSISGLESYVLRFWETEFKNIQPKRTGSGQRLYRRSDVELVLKIKHLLYEKKYTIQGAKQYLKTVPKRSGISSSKMPAGNRLESVSDISGEFLEEVKSELVAIRNLLI